QEKYPANPERGALQFALFNRLRSLVGRCPAFSYKEFCQPPERARFPGYTLAQRLAELIWCLPGARRSSHYAGASTSTPVCSSHAGATSVVVTSAVSPYGNERHKAGTR